MVAKTADRSEYQVAEMRVVVRVHQLVVVMVC
jgi:hypothetical protein